MELITRAGGVHEGEVLRVDRMKDVFLLMAKSGLVTFETPPSVDKHWKQSLVSVFIAYGLVVTQEGSPEDFLPKNLYRFSRDAIHNELGLPRVRPHHASDSQRSTFFLIHTFHVLKSLPKARKAPDQRRLATQLRLCGGSPATTYATRRGISSTQVPILEDFGLSVHHHLSPSLPSCSSTPA